MCNLLRVCLPLNGTYKQSTRAPDKKGEKWAILNFVDWLFRQDLRCSFSRFQHGTQLVKERYSRELNRTVAV